MTRWIVAASALGMGGIVTAALLMLSSPAHDSTQAYVAARDVAGGEPVAGAIALAPVSLPQPALAFTRRDAAALAALYATHPLAAGQVIQRTDVAPARPDLRLVFLPLKDAPATTPGSRVDLLAVTLDAAGATVVQPFATGVEVRASTGGGIVVAVSARQADAFVYASLAMHLVAVTADIGGGGDAEVPVSSADQAMQVAAQP